MAYQQDVQHVAENHPGVPQDQLPISKLARGSSQFMSVKAIMTPASTAPIVEKNVGPSGEESTAQVQVELAALRTSHAVPGIDQESYRADGDQNTCLYGRGDRKRDKPLENA